MIRIESRFLGSMTVRKDSEDPKLWSLLAPLSYHSRIFGGIITIPAGFVTDFASVPRIPVAYLLAGGIADESAMLHDYLFQTHNAGFIEANRIFLEAMNVQGIAWWRRTLIFNVACLIGWPYYKSGPSRYRALQ